MGDADRDETRWVDGLLGFLRHDKTREAGGVLLMALAILMLASLLSFDPEDPSFFHSASRIEPAHNLVGRFGAEMAGDLLGVFGAAALLVPLVLLGIGWRGLTGRPIGRKAARGAGLALLVAGISLSASLLSGVAPFSGGRVERPGGFLGDELKRQLFPLLGIFGTPVVALLFLALAGILLSRRPLLALAGAPSQVLGQAWGRARGFVAATLAARRERARRAAPRRPRRREPPGEPSATPAPSPASEGAAPTREEKGQRAFPFLPPREGHHPPPLSLLDLPQGPQGGPTKEEMETNSRILERKLQDFGVEGRVAEVHPGPVITRYEIEPGTGIKINRIVALADDLALALRAMSVRVVAPIPGKAAVGVEIPNQQRAVVHLREVLQTREYKAPSLQLPLALGKDIGGAPYVADLAQMPHLLIAGATGSGKSVCINALILSLLYRSRPEEVRLLLIDPKRVELSVYNGIPHLVDKVVVDPKEAAKRLAKVVAHMEERYRLFAQAGARNLPAYNRLANLEGPAAEEEAPPRGPLPMLVAIIDELADLMLTSAAEVETAIARLAQMARAVGIHLVVATQRPSVDVITGVIKANFPARLSFQVSSKVDSRTILDMNGAEQLLGSGDMLFIPPGSSKPVRIHGSLVTEVEIRRVVEFLANQARAPEFQWTLVPREERGPEAEDEEEDDDLYREAVELVVQTRQASISLLQRRLRVGFSRAGRLIDRMEREGIVSAMDGTRPREVLVEPPRA